MNAGPLYAVFAPAIALLCLLSASRLALVIYFRDRLADVPDLFQLFVVGFRIDASLVAYLSLLPALMVLVCGKRWVNALRFLPVLYWTFIFGASAFLELATVHFIAEYDLRPNRFLFEFLPHPREVFTMLWRGYKPALFTVIPLTLVGVYVTARAVNAMMKEYRPWRSWLRLAALVPVLAVLFLAGRGTLAHRPLNISMASFSENQLANQLALDSPYSLLYALYSARHEGDPERLYGKMPTERMLDLVRRAARVDKQRWVGGEVPLMRAQGTNDPLTRPLNLVIILEESLGAEHVGCLGGLPLTPNLDRLSKKGLLFRNLYSTGTRTARGIEAVLTGFLPTPGRSVIKLDRSQHDFFTLAGLLSSHGYETEFIFGGESHFDNMRGFFRNNGFDKIYDENSFPQAAFRATWGISDEDLFAGADQILSSHGDKPFFSLILSGSNHTPFEYPEGRIELYEEPANTRYNAMKYADYALGRFFERAERSDYYENTIFLVVADHNTRTYGNDLVPVNKFQIPGLIIAPGVPSSTYDRIASQIDLGPTLLDMIGLQVEHPMIGRSLLTLEEDDPGRAIMQFGVNNAYMRGDRVVVLQPNKPPLQFVYRSGRLVPAALEPELAQEALAHALLPGWLYRNRLYRLARAS